MTVLDSSQTEPQVEVQVLAHGRDLPLPTYQTSGSAGMDLHAAIEAPCTLQPLERRAIPTGLIMALPGGFEGQVRPRSGLSLRQGLIVVNAPGTIDSDYRGEIKVLLINLSREPQTISRGVRIAQLVIAPVVQARLIPVTQVTTHTARGAGGFGSTGQ